MEQTKRMRDLFSTQNRYIKPLLESFEYPNEAIFKINEYINIMLHKRIKGYFFMDDDILMGENVRISPLAVINGPAIIGANTEICAGAIINGNVIIGENCVVGNSSELKNCVLCDGVRLSRYNYVFNSIIGENVTLDASSGCADNNDLGNIGVVLGDGVNIGCGCVLNCGTVIDKDLTLKPLSVINGLYNK